MTAPTINGSAYPRPVDELLPAARQLADQLGQVPSRNRLMTEFRIGAPKANELRDLLASEGVGTVSQSTVRRDLTEVNDPVHLNEIQGADTPAGDRGTVPVEPAPDPGPDASRHREVGQAGQFLPAPAKSQASTDGHPGTLTQLKRVRWAVRAVLALGVAASIAGNVLHARDEIISQIISAWSPLALLLTVELISRVPVHRRILAVARWVSTGVIAGIAAWVSYWHMADVAARYGETGGSQYLLPLSVDGLVVVASICLVELGGRIRDGAR